MPSDKPAPAKVRKQSKKRSRSSSRKAATSSNKSAVVYLGHIPHGFYEEQMKGFFTQFGTILNLKLSRNKQTGNSKGYAFIQFEDEGTAEVVVEAMHGYILMGKHLVCEAVSPAKVHDTMFAGANEKFRKVPWRSIARDKHNKERTAQEEEMRARKITYRAKKKKGRLAELGIDYDFAKFAATTSVPMADEDEEAEIAKPVAKKTKKTAAAKKPAAAKKTAKKKPAAPVEEDEEVAKPVAKKAAARKKPAAMKKKPTKEVKDMSWIDGLKVAELKKELTSRKVDFKSLKLTKKAALADKLRKVA